MSLDKLVILILQRSILLPKPSNPALKLPGPRQRLPQFLIAFQFLELKLGLAFVGLAPEVG
jgi:hypothetical protein